MPPQLSKTGICTTWSWWDSKISKLALPFVSPENMDNPSGWNFIVLTPISHPMGALPDRPPNEWAITWWPKQTPSTLGSGFIWCVDKGCSNSAIYPRKEGIHSSPCMRLAQAAHFFPPSLSSFSSRRLVSHAILANILTLSVLPYLTPIAVSIARRARNDNSLILSYVWYRWELILRRIIDDPFFLLAQKSNSTIKLSKSPLSITSRLTSCSSEAKSSWVLLLSRPSWRIASLDANRVMNISE